MRKVETLNSYLELLVGAAITVSRDMSDVDRRKFILELTNKIDEKIRGHFVPSQDQKVQSSRQR